MNETRAKIFSWTVHIYTAMGLVCALYAFIALRVGSARDFFLWLMAAVLIDSTDGLLARRLRVNEVLPNFDGAKLDDITDYITYALLPMLAVVEWDLLPEGMAWFAALPLVASAYGFNQGGAKTEDAFVGFPSYWNVVVFYLFLFEFPENLNALVLGVLSVMVFWPIHYVYPTRARWLMVITLSFAVVWGVLVLLALLALGSEQALFYALISLAFPLYYVIISVLHHRRVAATLSAAN